MTYILLDAFAHYYPILDKHGDIKDFRTIERASLYKSKNDALESWIIVNVSGDHLRCDKCKKWFQVQNDCMGVFTCPYCGEYVEGM